jgi:hypothetical protein
MSITSTVLSRGSDKIFLAILLVCLAAISYINHPLASLAQSKTTISVDDFLSPTPGINGNVDLSDLESGDLAADVTPKRPVSKFYEDLWEPPGVSGLDENRLAMVDPYIEAIMDTKIKTFPRLHCPRPRKERYEILRRKRNFASRWDTPPRRWFFALNLYQCSYVLPRLLASTVEAIRFLRPEDCVLSIVGGRSDDGTTEILTKLRHEMEAMNVTYYFSTSDIDPMKGGNDRITELASLRNQVLDPLIRQPELYDERDTTVVFLNDVSICTDDILELIYQKVRGFLAIFCLLYFPRD